MITRGVVERAYGEGGGGGGGGEAGEDDAETALAVYTELELAVHAVQITCVRSVHASSTFSRLVLTVLFTSR